MLVPEFTLATPSQLDAWPKGISSCVDFATTQAVVFPLLEPSSKVEDEALDSDVGSTTRPCTECSLRGLTETPRSDEATFKCGSVRAARLVTQEVREGLESISQTLLGSLFGAARVVGSIAFGKLLMLPIREEKRQPFVSSFIFFFTNDELVFQLLTSL